MSKLSDAQLNEHLDKLLSFIDNTPINENGKTYLKGKVIVDILDTWHFDDEANDFTIDEYLANPNNPRFINVQTTYGVYNTTQLNRYLKNFIASFKKLRAKVLDKHLQELDKLHPTEKAARLSKSLASVNRLDLFQKHGIKEIKDPQWNNALKEILGSELSFAKEQSEILTKVPQFHNTISNQEEQEILLVDEIEQKLAEEAVKYYHLTFDMMHEQKFDPNYMGNFISGPMLQEYITKVRNYIRPLNNQEIVRYLRLSLEQFRTHTPPKRHKAFLRIYNDAYWYPNVMPYKENETWMNKYANHVWKHYSRHFNAFKEATERILSDFTQIEDNNSQKQSTTSKHTFETFVSPVKQKYILEMLENMSVTTNGVSILSERRKGVIRGIVEALRENHIIPQVGLDVACKTIADKIGLTLNSKLDWSKLSDETKKKAEKYIKEHPFE